MTVRKEDGKRMRHSSSWPDRTPQTVKVRVDPLSRAFTIIPTIREGFHPLLDATRPATWIDEIVLLDHAGSTSVETKRRFVDETRLARSNGRGELGETFELRTFVPDVMNWSWERDRMELSRGFWSSEAAADCTGEYEDTSHREERKSKLVVDRRFRAECKKAEGSKEMENDRSSFGKTVEICYEAGAK